MSDQFQFLVGDGVANRTAFGVFDDEEAGTTSAVYIGRKIVIEDDIEEPEPFDVARGLVALPASPFKKVGFHHLAVVPAQLLEDEYPVGRHRLRITADAACVDGMAFFQSRMDADVFGFITVCQVDRNIKRRFQTVVD